VNLGHHAIQIGREGNLAVDQPRYILADNLGSPNVILDAGGEIDHILEFDPWGKRLDPTYSDSLVNRVTNRGYTGHEMDDEMGVINMNARIYDPQLGRFFSADPVLPDATDLQQYNRYSYVGNNPMSFIDPSGNRGISLGTGTCLSETHTITSEGGFAEHRVVCTRDPRGVAGLDDRPGGPVGDGWQYVHPYYGIEGGADDIQRYAAQWQRSTYISDYTLARGERILNQGGISASDAFNFINRLTGTNPRAQLQPIAPISTSGGDPISAPPANSPARGTSSGNIDTFGYQLSLIPI